MQVVTMLNQKGGVGKTSTCFHLSGTLAAMGYRVLLVDADPQASLTQGFLGPVVTYGLDPASTIASLFRGDSPFPSEVIRPTGVAGVDILPGSEAATSFNLPDAHLVDGDSQGCLRSFLEEVDGDYDLAIIDCPPNLHLCSWAALVASDWIVVPVQPEDFGAQGVGRVRRWVSQVQAGPNPSLRLAGYLLTLFDRRRSLHLSYETSMREIYGDLVFAARFPAAAGFIEAVASGLPIANHKPKSAPSKAIAEVAVELIRRLSSVPQQQSKAEVA